MLLGKPWEDVSATDLERLVEEAFCEGVRLDFNRAFPTKKSQPDSTAAKTSPAEEWLGICKVAAAFANTKGGILAVGVTEESGIATEIEGVEIPDWERLRQEILQKLRNTISPPLNDPYLFNVLLPSGKSVVIIEIAPSLRIPHFVRIATGINVFYKRIEAGIIDMSIEEIREAFSKTETWIDRAKALRTERIDLAFSDDAGPFALSSPAFFFHLLPLGPRDQVLPLGNTDVRREFSSAVTECEKKNGGQLFYPPEKLCFEGLLFKRNLSDEHVQHLLISRDGAIELAGHCGDFQEETVLAQVAWEKIGLDFLAHILPLLLKHELYPPFLLCYSIIGVKNRKLRIRYPIPTIAEGATRTGLSRDKYLLPAVLIDSLPSSTDSKILLEHLKQLYQPFFDMIWNDVDRERSPNSLVH